LYKMAWLRGLKSTYYLRTLGATSTEKSTVTTGTLNAVNVEAANDTTKSEPKLCLIENPECEACQ
jgi:ribonucleoside-diphosphate reductase alpha chain